MNGITKIFNLLLLVCLLVYSCDEDPAGSGSSIPGEGDIIGSWSTQAISMSANLFVEQSVEFLDAWNPIASGSMGISLTYDSLEAMEFEFDYFNIEVEDYCYFWNNDYPYDESEGCLEFELSTHSDWSQWDEGSNYSDLEIICISDMSYCEGSFWYDDFEYDSENISIYGFEVETPNWNASDYMNFSLSESLIVNDFYNDNNYDVQVDIDVDITADLVNLSPGNAFYIMGDTDEINSGTTEIVTFADDGTFSIVYIINCEGIEADYDWDCYDLGCTPVYSNDDSLIGCIDTDCSQYESESDCWDNNACEWHYDYDSCVEWEDYGYHYDNEGTWIYDGGILTITNEDYEDSMEFYATLDNNHLILSREMFPCQDDGYYDDDDMTDECLEEYFEGFAQEVFGLDADDIENIIWQHSVDLAPYSSTLSRDLDASGNQARSSLLYPRTLGRIKNR